MVLLRSPAPEVRYTLAGVFSGSNVPERVALQALALAVSWPSPPWEAVAQLDVDRASQEERESRQFLQVAREAEVSDARRALLQARQALQSAEEARAATRFQLRDVHGDARIAMERLVAAGVAPVVWSEIGGQLVTAWTAELMPAPADTVSEVLTFTLPPSALTSDGGSGSPTSTPGTP